MSDDLRALAERAVACPAWRWMPGMLAYDDGTGVPSRDHLASPGLPVLDDPATLGCVLALVREAWGDPSACMDGGRDLSGRTVWVVGSTASRGTTYGRGPTEDAALIAALEAAPARGVEVPRD